jgi:hypothetical protein
MAAPASTALQTQPQTILETAYRQAHNIAYGHWKPHAAPRGRSESALEWAPAIATRAKR